MEGLIKVFRMPVKAAYLYATLLDLSMSCSWLVCATSGLLMDQLSESEEKKSITNPVLIICTTFVRILTTAYLWACMSYPIKLEAEPKKWLASSVVVDLSLLVTMVYVGIPDLYSPYFIIALIALILLRFLVSTIEYYALRVIGNCKVDPNVEDFPCSNDGSLEGDPKMNTLNRQHMMEIAAGQNELCLGVQPRWGISEAYHYLEHCPQGFGAKAMLFLEICWSSFFVTSRFWYIKYLNGDLLFFHLAEDVGIKIWRIFLSIVAILCLTFRRKGSLRFWIIVYLWTLFISMCIMSYSGVVVSGEKTYIENVIILCTMGIFGVSDLALRFLIIHLTLRFTFVHADGQGSLSMHERNSAHLGNTNVQTYFSSLMFH